MDPERLFEQYLREYFAENPSAAADPEEALTKAYSQWADEPTDELGGKSPREAIEGITDIGELLKMAESSVKRGGEPSPLVMDRIVELPAERELTEILEGDGDDRMRTLAAELLSRMDKLPVLTSLELVFDPDESDVVREALIDKLKYADNVAPALLERIDGTADKKILAELLVSTGVREDRIYDLLLGLLRSGDCLPFAAQLLAEYGDERAIEPLSELAETAVYADYIELRNAVEGLGGELTLRFNWEGDATYKKIKGE